MTSRRNATGRTIAKKSREMSDRAVPETATSTTYHKTKTATNCFIWIGKLEMKKKKDNKLELFFYETEV